MKQKKLTSLAIITTLLTSLPLTLQASAQETSFVESKADQLRVIMPRFAYINSTFIAVDPSSSNVAYEVMVDGISDVTSISGTLTLYKENASGRFEKKTSKSLRASGDKLEVYGTFPSYGAGNYKLTFSGTVYVNGGSESFSFSEEDSY